MSSADDAPQQWNIKFTTLLRSDEHTCWGNWALNPQLKVGSVGFLNAKTATFTIVGFLPSFKTVTEQCHSFALLMTSAVRSTSGNASLSAGADEVSASLTGSWTFGNDGELLSQAKLASRDTMVDIVPTLHSNIDWLKSCAEGVGGLDCDGNLLQGFGVITSVANASHVVNVGSLKSETSFTIGGSLSVGSTGDSSSASSDSAAGTSDDTSAGTSSDTTAPTSSTSVAPSASASASDTVCDDGEAYELHTFNMSMASAKQALRSASTTVNSSPDPSTGNSDAEASSSANVATPVPSSSSSSENGAKATSCPKTVALSYSFATFSGDTVLPSWSRPVSALSWLLRA